jgi:hypothetical protein
MQCDYCKEKPASGACIACRSAIFCSDTCYARSGHASTCPARSGHAKALTAPTPLGVLVADAPMGAPTHLIVLLHGLQAKPSQMQPIADALAKAARQAPMGVRVHILQPEAVATSLWTPRATFQGIDVGGEALAGEIVKYYEREKLARGTRISFVGHSLGGMYARFVIGYLEALGWFESAAGERAPSIREGRAARLVPSAYISLATPHLGVSKSPDNWLLRALVDTAASYLLQRTGHQLSFEDGGAASAEPAPSTLLSPAMPSVIAFALGGANELTGQAERDPLLVVMSAPMGVYMRGLKRFARHVLYSNTRDDIQVGYTSSAILSTNPYARMQMLDAAPDEFLPGYPHLISPRTMALHHPDRARLQHVPEAQYQEALQPPLARAFETEPDAARRAWMRTMLDHLQHDVDWERYDAEIRLPLVAHDALVGFYGVTDVVQHLADHFVF